MPQKHNLFYAVADKVSDFFYDLFRSAAPFPSPCIRYDTVGAEIVASEHDVYQGFAVKEPL